MNTEQQSRRKGNVARLPKELREKINSMMDDGATYPQIIEELEKSISPQLPYSISVNNLSNWFEGGYQDYLRDQAWRERLDTNANRYLEVGLTDGTKLAAGGLYAASVQICKLIDELANPNASETDPEKCSRVTNALSRLSRSILQLQQYRDAIERAKAADPASKESQAKARQDMLDKMDQLFGIRPEAEIDRIFFNKGRDDRACQAEVPPSSVCQPLNTHSSD
jgi:hypothetical protein